MRQRTRVMNSREEAKCFGDAARSRAAKHFTREEQLLKLTNLVLEEFGDSCNRELSR